MKPETSTPAFVDIRQLHVTFTGGKKPVQAVSGVDLRVQRGEVVALIGESGSGKSVTLRTLLRLHAEKKTQITGQIRVGDQDVLSLSQDQLSRFRGRVASMIFQEPLLALDPVYSLGQQIIETIRRHENVSEAEARQRALALFERVRIPSPERRLQAYPHEMSGGMRQRAMIALALACRPQLLLADEPTTALDATLQHEVLQLLLRLVQEDGMALLLISHDLALMARSVQRLAVMYAGRFVEQGDTAQVLANPAHPYTQGLLAARPRLGAGHSRRGRAGDVAPLATIPGRVPGLHEMPPGCAFAPRCAQAGDACRSAVPQLREVHAAAPGWQAACVRVGGA
jgi:peptide/nickel transport system ATP-binding protein